MSKTVRNTAIIEALSEDVRGYGIKLVAPEIDKEVSSLYGELNPYGEQQKGKLGLDDAIEIMRIVGVRALILMANELGYDLTSKIASPDGDCIKGESLQAYHATNEFLQKANDPTTTPQQLALLRNTARKELDDVEALANNAILSKGISGR